MKLDKRNAIVLHGLIGCSLVDTRSEKKIEQQLFSAAECC